MANDTVSTLSDLAVLQTGIRVVHVSIIAFFFALLYNAISASCLQTVASTRVVVIKISVIAFLPFLNDPVSTAGESTLRRTAIIILVVTIVTGFDPKTNKAISAGCDCTRVGAYIVIVLIAVITSLEKILAIFVFPRRDDAITTSGEKALVRAAVVVSSISVVTLLA